MVNMANLPQGKEFSWKGGVKSIARGKERSSDPALSLAAQILISRGYNGLGSSVSHKADAHKNMLSNKILANNGLELQADGSYRQVSAEKARAAVNADETGAQIISKGLTR